jgi:polyvinyl alcohol dehydrogenase (cytochrome)
LKVLFFRSLLLLAGFIPAVAQTAECRPLPDLSGWAGRGIGLDLHNTRYQRDADLFRDNVHNLKVAWVFGLDGGQSPHSWFAVSVDTVFIASPGGVVYALDRTTGCIRWQRHYENGIRTGLVHGKLSGDLQALWFGTGSGNVWAIDARQGNILWKADTREHPFNFVTGTPTFNDGVLYVPVSSMELGLAINPLYGCCTSRGSLIALSAATGKLLWRTPVIDEAPAVSGRHLLFVEQWGPSGAPVWSAPTVDTVHGRVFIGTGENYTHPTSTSSDAIIAMDLKTGHKLWTRQFTGGDAFNLACAIHFRHPNCPDEPGPDLDFGAPPILTTTADGQGLILAGQKSGDVHALLAQTGEVLWSTNLGRGGYLGGVHWGMALHEGMRTLFVPISDIPLGVAEGAAKPGLYALTIDDGKLLWSAPLDDGCKGKEPCRHGMSAAITATDELVFATTLDGRFQVHDARSGAVLFTHDTWATFDSVNGVPASGGTIDVHGPYVSGDMVFLQSGYGSFGQKGGNALIAYRLDNKSPDTTAGLR